MNKTTLLVTVQPFQQNLKQSQHKMVIVLDISEWQGNLTDAQVKQLKQDYDFIIIRGQYGSEYVDQCLENNSTLLDKNNMKFGVYSYSLYKMLMMLEMKLKRFIVVHLKLHSM